jgi:hypothetical protein
MTNLRRRISELEGGVPSPLSLSDKTLIDDLWRIATEGHRKPGAYAHPFHVRHAAGKAAARLTELLAPEPAVEQDEEGAEPAEGSGGDE